MKKLFLPLILDGIISAFAVFLLSFCLMRTALLALPSFILSLVFGICVGVMLYLYLDGKKGKSLLKNEAKYKLGAAMHTLNIYTDDEISRLFNDFFNKKGICTNAHGRYMTLNGENMLILLFLPRAVSVNELYFALRQLNGKNNYKKVAVMSFEFSPDAANEAEKLGVTLLSGEQILVELEKEKLLPEAEAPPIKKRNIIKLVLLKSGGKRFIFYGSCLLMLSLVSFFPIYYLVSGTIFCVYGIIAMFFGSIKSNKDTLFNYLDKIEKGK